MRKKLLSLLSVVVVSFFFLSCAHLNKDVNPRKMTLLDFEWYFHSGKIENGQTINLDTKGWRMVDLPHDWSIENIEGTHSPFDSTALGGIDYGYLKGGTAWYRKKIDIPDSLRNNKISICFEGVYMNSDVWINGNHLGNHPYGYTSFEYDITKYLNFGQSNILAVEVKNEGKTSRWYPGSGIYRHVWLKITGPLHVATWGTFITTPEVTKSRAKVVLQNKIVNERSDASKLLITTKILDAGGNVVSLSQSNQSVAGSSESNHEQTLVIKNPSLWSVETPNLYTAVTEITEDGILKDMVETNFGIRSLRFSTEGFFLNGKKVLLKGGCMHHDNGPLGAAAYDRAEERRVELMKANGFNAIRCSHNPPSTAFLNACDKLGMLVIDESFDCWRLAKNPQDYHLYFDDWWKRDLESMVLRDRNHPSVIMWSIGNEIPETSNTEGTAISKMLGDYVQMIDSTRPITSAVCFITPEKDAFFETLGVAGYNYAVGSGTRQGELIQADHKRVPGRIFYNSESFPLEAFSAWMDVLDNSYVIGDFVWTGFDYLGEASIGWLGHPTDISYYPWNHAFCGDIDICGFKRPQSYYRDVLWKHTEGYPVSVFVKPPVPTFDLPRKRADWSRWYWPDLVSDWNWEGYEGQMMDITVYCMYPEVELFLNGKSFGKKPTNRNTEWTASFQVPYSKGSLKAVGYEGEMVKSVYTLSTTGQTIKIGLKPDRTTINADGQDLCFITVELQDSNGLRTPKATNKVTFKIEGPGSIIAVGSSNPRSVESFQKPYRNAYQGRCLVIVKAERKSGRIVLRAETDKIKPTSVIITAKPCTN